jgi:hypothetical protein
MNLEANHAILHRVSLVRSNLEETKTNLHGIACIHVDGEDDVVSSLNSSANLTDIKEKMNEIIEDIGKIKEFKTNTASRLLQMENRIDNFKSVANTAAALKSEKSESLQVQNSALLETALIIVCICFTVFMSLQVFSFVKRNFLGRPKPMRASSENPLTMNVEYD